MYSYEIYFHRKMGLFMKTIYYENLELYGNTVHKHTNTKTHITVQQ